MHSDSAGSQEHRYAMVQSPSSRTQTTDSSEVAVSSRSVGNAGEHSRDIS